MNRTGLVLDRAALYQALKGPKGPVWKGINNASEMVRTKARQFAPVDQGDLRASIEYEIRDDNGPVGYVGSVLDYAVYVHEGTGIYAKKNPQMIRPKSKPFLAWPVKNNKGGRRRYKGGKTAAYAYAKAVKGSPARPFLRQAVMAIFGKKI